MYRIQYGAPGEIRTPDPLVRNHIFISKVSLTTIDQVRTFIWERTEHSKVVAYSQNMRVSLAIEYTLNLILVSCANPFNNYLDRIRLCKLANRPHLFD
jgi:hypothetical protein